MIKDTHYPGKGLTAVQSAANAMAEFNRRYAMIKDKDDWYDHLIEMEQRGSAHGIFFCLMDRFMTSEEDLFNLQLAELAIFISRLNGTEDNLRRQQELQNGTTD